MQIRDFNLLRILSDNHEFTLLCLSYDSQEGASVKIDRLLQICKDVHVIPYPKNDANQWSRKLNVTERFLNPRPWMSRALTPAPFVDRFRALATQGHFDIVHVNHIEMGILLRDAVMARRVLGIEMLAPKARRLAEIESRRVRRLFLRLEEAKLRRYERWLCSQADLWTMASHQECQLVQALCDRPAVVAVPNGVDTSLYSPDLTSVRRNHDNSLLFVGSLAYAPNSDAVSYFYRSCWPELKVEFPQLRWRIVGRDAPDEIRALAEEDNRIEVTGWVDDIRPYLQQSLALVVPLRSGGGTRLKILEALAAGLPVISSTVGAEGLDVETDRDILIADSPGDFTEGIRRLLVEPGVPESLIREGRRLVESQYDWRTIARKLDDAYQGLFQ